MENVRITIVGGGPGGYEAAAEGAKLGAKVTLIEKKKLGGTCLNEGCIPTKSLYSSSNFIKMIKSATEYGMNVSEYSFDYEKIVARKNNVVSELVQGVEGLLKKHKVVVKYGEASIMDTNHVQVLNDELKETIESDYIIIATGSKPKILPIDGVESSDNIITSKELLALEELPKELIIVGGGVIGVEFASIMNAFGVHVTIVEYLSQILSQADSAISKRLKSFLKKEDINIINSAKVTGFSEICQGEDKNVGYEENNSCSDVYQEESNQDNCGKINNYSDINTYIKVTYEDKKGYHSMIADKVLISTGRIGNLDLLNSSTDINIKTDNNFITTDDCYKTNIDNIYAIGDVNGKSLLAHSATWQGISVVKNIMLKEPINESCIPSAVFTFPEVAMAGLTEDEIRSKGIDYKVGKALYSANGKAKAMAKTDGFIKVIASKEGQLLGVHIIGEHASDIIHEGVVAIENNISLESLLNTVHAHPTLNEIFYEAIKATL